MVSLIAPENKEAKTMFKWNNPFSWAYTGNITDSDITQRVINAGGRVDGCLRFSHSWNYPGMRNASLMDLHVFMPGSNQEVIYKNGKEIHDNYGNGNRVGWNNRKEYFPVVYKMLIIHRRHQMDIFQLKTQRFQV